MAFRFLHAADLHLDTPFAGLSAASPSVGAALREASLDAFDNLVRLAIARDVAFVVLAGDLYDGPQRGVRAQLRLLRGVTRLAERGIATFMVAGNHDPVDEGWSAIHEWPELVTVFPPGDPTSVVVERDGRAVAVVHGVSYARRAELDNLALRFQRDDRPGPHIAVLHANVGGQPGHDPYSPASVEELVRTGMDYWALGHVHTRQVLNRDPWIVYPGNLQARSPRRSEQGAKGALVVTVDDSGRVKEPEFVALDRVRFDHVEVDIANHTDVGSVCASLIEAGNAALATATGRSLILRATLVGRGQLHADLTRPGTVPDLLSQLRDEAPEEVPFLWWDRIDLATAADRDLDDLRSRNDFVADLLDEAEHWDPDAVTTGWAEQLPADLRALLDSTEPDLLTAERWTKARDLAIDLVTGTED